MKNELPYELWEPVIGLEIHAQLNTKSKIFSPAPLGFLAIARGLEARITAGGTAAELKMWQAQLLNNRVDAGVTAVFLVLVAIVVAANARVWWQLLAGKRPSPLREEPYVPVAGTAKA